MCQAREYFQRATEASNVDGFYNLGILYLKGLGVEKDYSRARELLVDAANKGHLKARYHLAIMLHKGTAGMKKDLAHVSAGSMGSYCVHWNIMILLRVHSSGLY